MEPIAGDVITEELHRKRQIVITESIDRGGVSYYHPAYLDFLLENEIINETQKACGISYWGMKEAAFAFLNTQNPLFRDVQIPSEEPLLTQEFCDGTDAFGLYITLTRTIPIRLLNAIDAACTPLPDNYLPSKMEILWAFGENTLSQAFDELEKQLPIAREAYKKKQEDENIPCNDLEYVY